jgi:hypothetical protein
MFDENGKNQTNGLISGTSLRLIQIIFALWHINNFENINRRRLWEQFMMKQISY